MISYDLHSVIKNLFDTLFVTPRSSYCFGCGSTLMTLDTTFFSAGRSGKIWTAALPVCPECDLKKDTARFISRRASTLL